MTARLVEPGRLFPGVRKGGNQAVDRETLHYEWPGSVSYG